MRQLPMDQYRMLMQIGKDENDRWEAEMAKQRRVVETARIDGALGAPTVEQYLSSKPDQWKLWEWKWANVEPRNPDREWNAVEATWEPRP